MTKSEKYHGQNTIEIRVFACPCHNEKVTFGLWKACFRPGVSANLFRCMDQKKQTGAPMSTTSQAVFATFFRTQFVSAGAGRWERHRALPAAVCFASKKKVIGSLETGKNNKQLPHMRTMVLVYKNLHNWVIFDKGKCWYTYSSTMIRIWV